MRIGPLEVRWRETRAEGYTDLITEAILNAANAETASASETATAHACASLWARTLSSAVVEGDGGAVTPAWLHSLGTDLIVQGQHLSLIDVSESGAVRLRRSSSWDVNGDADPQTWRYRADLPGPSGSVTRSAPSDGVVWIPWRASASEPWRGVSPLGGATSTALTALERSISQESATPTGFVQPVPADGADSTLGGLKTGLAKLRGGLSFVESTASGWGDGRVAAPQRDWAEATRLGPRYAEGLWQLRPQLVASVAQACGIPAPLIAASGADGTARRAAWRDFVFGMVMPMTEIVAGELGAKLERPVNLDVSHLVSSDTALTQARTVAQLVASGVSVSDALDLAGFGDAD